MLYRFSNNEIPSQILLLDHPKKKIRDTQKYKPFKKAVKVCCVRSQLSKLTKLVCVIDFILGLSSPAGLHWKFSAKKYWM